MQAHDDELLRFVAHGAVPLPEAARQGSLAHDGARIWYAAYGSGAPIILLHGGLGNSGNWGYQIPFLLEHGYQAIVIDSRGHGRSTRDERPFSYDLMATDVLAVMDTLEIAQAHIVGWSDGAVIALALARRSPERVKGVLFFACNVDASGVKPFLLTPTLERCVSRHQQDYAALSATPDEFEDFAVAVAQMQQTQPNYTAEDLAQIHVPVVVVHSEHDEFIRREHAEYLARTLPQAELVDLPEVSHFAPLQRPGLFNQALLRFLGPA